MKILMIAPVPFFNDRGCSIRVYEEAMALQRRGHKVKIVAYHLGADMKGLDIERSISIPWYQRIEAGPSWHRLYIDLLVLLKALSAQRRFRADIVHGHIHEGCLIGWVVARLFGAPLLFDYQGSMTEEIAHYDFITKKGFLHTIFRTAESIINHLADKIVVSSGTSVTLLTKQFGINPELVSPLLDGIGVSVPSQRATGTILRRELGIPDDAFIIAYAGSLSGVENMEGMFAATQEVLARESRIFFLILGYPNVTRWRTYVEKQGIDKRVLFTGRIPYLELPRYLDLAEITISTKLQVEANGKLYNYMKAGKPIVAFDHPINREILADLGCYPAEMTPESFAHEILIVLALPQHKRDERGQALKTRVEKYFSWDIRVIELEEEYRKLISNKKHDAVVTSI